MGKHQWSARHEALLSHLRKTRVDHALTQKKLAMLLNRPQSYISKYELGERRLDILELQDICHACGISLQEFVARLENGAGST